MTLQKRTTRGGPGQPWLRRLGLALILLLLALGPQQLPLRGPADALAQEPAATEETTTQQEATTEPTGEATTEPTQEAAEPAPEATTEPTQEATTEPTQEATTEPTQEATLEATPTLTATVEATPTLTPTLEVTPTLTPTIEATPTLTPTLEATPTLTPTVELTATTTITPVATPELSFAVAAAPDYYIDLEVIELGGGQVTNFTYLVNEDNSGDPTDPDSANHPSLKPMASYSPVVAAGNGTNGYATIGLPDLDENRDDRFLISVRAEGYKLGGVHYREGDTPLVRVELVPDPLPLSRINVHVFHDNAPVNGEDDIPREQGLGGFHVVVEDTVGEVTVDWYGNPLCGGYCMTDSNGNVTIENLPHGKYEVLVIPPNGTDWVQTTTIEGTHIIDAWIEEGNSGDSPREGFQQAMVWVGFVQPMDNWNSGGSTVQGTARFVIEWTPPLNPVVLGDAVYKPWIALTDIGANDEQVYLGRGDENGYFEIDHVPDGVYQMAIWDDPLDVVMAFRTVTVSGGDVDLGDFGVPRWFGWISGHVFRDDNGNMIQDPGEPGIGGLDLGTRFRDGTLQYGTFTDNNGYYEFPEVFELEKFAVAEVGFGRFARTGASVHDDYDRNVIKSTHEGALTLAELTWAAKRSVIDWGKKDYLPGENGGISGIVYHAITRNEFNARLALPEDYEPGIPGVTLRLWGPGEDGILNTPDTPSADDVLLNEITSDAWEHPSDCDALDSNGDPLSDPLDMGPKCIEVPNISNEVKDGVFDGGYAFETMFPDGYPDGAEVALTPGDYIVETVLPPFYQILREEDQNTDEGLELMPAFPPPACVGPLHLVQDDRNPYNGEQMPLCNRKLVTLQDQQNAAADFFMFATDTPYDLNDPGSSWTTDEAVPPPGRIFGFLLDDLNVETDPAFIYYGEKRGIPNTPVGIRDYAGRLITTVQSDENGIFEVMLPSTYTADCPIPSGVCPAMYRVVGNDPGDPDNPNFNFNPNYQTITFVFDVWPGKTTYADVALFPITAFVAFPGSQFNQLARCDLPSNTPQLWEVSTPYGSPGDSFTITGQGFGAAQGGGQVTINRVPLTVNTWTGTSLEVTVPAGFTPGPGQLLITNNDGQVTINGLTFHVLGGSYTPAVVSVDPGPGTPIQDAIDGASPGSLVVIRAGTYFEDIALNKAVKLQGVGPGNPAVAAGSGGSILDERFATAGVRVSGDPGAYSDTVYPQLDGVRIINSRDEDDIGGGLHVAGNSPYLQISNNLIQSNGGNFGGGITLGLAYQGDNNNDYIRILHNRILNNGGISLAGGIGIFNGADDYEIAYNQICGNYSGEYGGGISHFGLSQRGHIHHNQLYYNNAFDEGGAIMIAGELPVAPATFTNGAGEVTIDHNLIQSNMSNDDGGGIRLLQPLDFKIDIFNNVIVNNVATDIGGGLALDDASQVNIFNNTIARNISTGTAEDADRTSCDPPAGQTCPHGGGLVSEGYSSLFVAYLENIIPGSSAPGFANPVLFNNIFWDNLAFFWTGTDLVPAATPVIDLEVFGGPPASFLNPTYSSLTVPYPGGSNNLVGDPQFVNPYGTTLTAVPFRMEPDFVTVVMVTLDLPPVLLGDYHVAGTSPVIDAGTAAVGPVLAPCDDIDADGRPNNGLYDIGADEQPGLALPPGCGPFAPVNLPPIVNAGPDQEIILPNSATLSGVVSDSDGLLISPPVITWAPGGGPGTVTFADASLASTTASFSTAGVYTLTLSADDGQYLITDEIVITATGSGGGTIPAADFYFSIANNGTYNIGGPGGVTGVRDEDILGRTGSGYIMIFDGSDVGVGGLDIDAFTITSPDTILLSFATAAAIPGIPGTVDDSDIVLFSGTLFGNDTDGTFSLFFDGSLVGLTSGGEDVDAVELLPDGRLLVSTSGGYSVPNPNAPPNNISGRNEDLLAFTPASPDVFNTGSGSWDLYFDGSDVGLNSNGKNVDGVFVDGSDIYLTVGGTLTTPFAGPVENEDIFVCQGVTTGSATSCAGGALFFDGSSFGLNNRNLDGIEQGSLP